MASEVKEESNSTPSDVKNDAADEEMKDVDSKMKDGDKDSLKNESKEESGKEGSDDDNEDDDDDDEEEEVALLDRPVVMTGCRARKKVERLEMSFSTPKDKHEFPEGKGKKLGECPRIEAQIQKIKVVDLKPLHKILFNRTGSANEIKKNIRKFCGFPFDKDSADYSRKKTSTEKMTASVLKKVCVILDIERGGSKEEIVKRIMTFLMNPEDSGKKVPSTKKKASKDKKKSTGKKGKSEKKSKAEINDDSDEEADKSEEDDDSTGGESSMGGTDEEANDYANDEASKDKKKSTGKKGKSEKKSKAEKNDDSDEEADKSEEDDDSTGGEASMGGTDEEANDDASDEEPKKKSKEKKKTSKAKSKADKGKKEEKKTKGTKRKQDDDDDDDDSSASSSDEQPPAKKSKMPSNDEISKLVKHILESADLQEITMKKVIKQVSDAYPDFDLTHKKAFIKSTIKSVIS